MATIFKAYDIRGIYPEQLNEERAYLIGRRLPEVVLGKRALLGRDMRPSSPPLCEALCRGLQDAGYNVDIAGLTSTPMVYYLTAKHGYDLSIQITASHNPTAYNGFKVSRREARPVGYDTGLQQLEALVARSHQPPPVATRGQRREVSRLEEFLYFLRPWQRPFENLKLAVDCSDGLAALTAKPLLGTTPLFLADTPDGSFPSHSPNPLEAEAREPLVGAVLGQQLDLGVIFDGDVDRVMFIDEKGNFVRPDQMIPLLAHPFLQQQPGATILQDIRTSRVVTRQLEQAGAKPAMWKVGHAFAKEKMRELGAIFGGELAGHYYFRDFFWCDSGELAALIALGEVAAAKERGLTLSRLLEPCNAVANTGELNYRVENSLAVLESIVQELLQAATPERMLDFDGYRLEYPDWWVSLRRSNTEPYLRLIIEADNQSLLAAKRDQLERLLQPFL